MKSKDYISWDEYFMGISILTAYRSKDPRTPVGCCIVDQLNRVVSLGYNGMPIGCSDDVMPWEREGDYKDTKYAYVCHAELNAILNSNGLPQGCKIYTTLFPCNECCKAIIQTGIKEIVYLSDKYHDEPNYFAARKLLDTANIKYTSYVLSGHNAIINL